jgi:hypothetical protein
LEFAVNNVERTSFLSRVVFCDQKVRHLSSKPCPDNKQSQFSSIGFRSGFFLSSRNYIERIPEIALVEHDLILRECRRQVDCTAKDALEKVHGILPSKIKFCRILNLHPHHLHPLAELLQ